MKYIHYLIAVFSFCSMTALAQETAEDSVVVLSDRNTHEYQQNFSEKHFRFVYIDHEDRTPVATLHERLEDLHNDALESGNFLIVYLADEDQPIVSFTNLIDPVPNGQRSSEEAFNNIVRQMYRTSHEVWASADLDSLKWLLGTDGVFPLFDEHGAEPKLNFKSVVLDFYVGSQFWNLRYNEDLLSQLFVSLKMGERLNTPTFPLTKLSFNVLKPRGVELLYQPGMPFGRKNLGKINEKIEIKNY